MKKKILVFIPNADARENAQIKTTIINEVATTGFEPSKGYDLAMVDVPALTPLFVALNKEFVTVRIPFVRDEEGNTHYITGEIEALNSMDSFRKAAMPLLANWVSSIAESPAPTWEEGKVPDPVDAVRAYLFETFMSGTAFVSLGHGEDAYYLPVITPKNIKNVLK